MGDINLLRELLLHINFVGTVKELFTNFTLGDYRFACRFLGFRHPSLFSVKLELRPLKFQRVHAVSLLE